MSASRSQKIKTNQFELSTSNHLSPKVSKLSQFLSLDETYMYNGWQKSSFQFFYPYTLDNNLCYFQGLATCESLGSVMNFEDFKFL